MLFVRGHSPELQFMRHAVGRSRLVFITLTLGTLFAAPAMAQQRAPLTMAEAEDIALAHEPGQAALLARAAAFEERAIAAGELPSPTMRVGLNNYPIESGNFRTEGMTNAAIGFSQAFPAGSTRAFSARRFDSLAAEMSENAEAQRRDVLTAVRSAWLDLYYWGRTHELVSESRPFFDDLATVTRSLYSVGRKSQQDVLRAELELSRLQDRLIEVKRQRARAQAALGEWLGRDAMRPLASTLPRWEQVPGLETLQSGLAEHPALRAADAQIAAHEASVELAGERSKPGWVVDLGYSYRDGNLPSGGPRSDFVSVGVTIDLPFLSKKSIDSRLSAALKERSAAKSEREQTLRSLQSQLIAEHARWRELTRRVSLYEARILSQAKDHADASLLVYQSDRGDFADVMRAAIDDLNTRIEHIRLQVERAQSFAVLANLGGLSR